MNPRTAVTLAELLELEKIDYELVFVNDGSRDGTWPAIQKRFMRIPGW